MIKRVGIAVALALSAGAGQVSTFANPRHETRAVYIAYDTKTADARSSANTAGEAASHGHTAAQ